ncbi:CDP-alcohol phosphatidyltransferase family protein [Kordiimonas sp. SCSIO 12603]|uniref:CDP-alcohol phosphatidyltransferase family protein n=1 Tax=Kordiimonas sp. SCSIO 12603 TaxID=2829596 RepID=UPI0021064320|nr:CDP-alcohol phosphatidyltransferase family protein [Kordiimonas sp. SCSIO 12603]UTW59315.1 CDP-alcohol phosphatidyltransferase family protein [Kordiimonas sp. SCSIO 12603]
MSETKVTFVKPPEYGRPNSIEDASNKYFIHPLSELVVEIGIALKLSPNIISFMGMGCGFLAAYLYYYLPQTPYVIGGFLAMIGWHVFDGADGKLARATGKTSAFGRIIDGICDHVVFSVVYISLALHLVETGYSPNVWWLVIGAGISHAVQAAGYEERRQKYQRRIEGLHRTSVQDKLLHINGKKSFLASLYDKAQKLVAGADHGLDCKLMELSETQWGKGVAGAVIMRTIPMVKAWALLNANNRTLLIFIFAFMGQPALYFAVELILFNIIMLGLIIAEWQQEKTLIEYANTFTAPPA